MIYSQIWSYIVHGVYKNDTRFYLTLTLNCISPPPGNREQEISLLSHNHWKHKHYILYSMDCRRLPPGWLWLVVTIPLLICLPVHLDLINRMQKMNSQPSKKKMVRVTLQWGESCLFVLVVAKIYFFFFYFKHDFESFDFLSPWNLLEAFYATQCLRRCGEGRSKIRDQFEGRERSFHSRRITGDRGTLGDTPTFLRQSTMLHYIYDLTKPVWQGSGPKLAVGSCKLIMHHARFWQWSLIFFW